MRLGLIEVGVLCLVSSHGGYLSVSRVKELLSDYPHCVRGLIPGSEYWRVRSIHVSILRALRSLSDKGLVSLDCRGSRVMGVSLNFRGVVDELALRCHAVQRLNKE